MVRDKPLKGLRVADFSMVYAGPICARMLSDNGAEVTKIEPLGIGDTIRANNRIFSHFNAGKKSIQIDLSKEQGQEIALKIVDQSDVLIENYRPGIMTRFSLDYETLKEQHPKLIYCSISGFGQTGPDSQRAAYAPIAHAASGYDVSHMRAQLEDNPRPQASGIMIADMLTGAYAYGAIQTALLGQLKSGVGDFIDVTMLESSMMLIPGQQQNAQRVDSPRIGGFQPIVTKDGYLMICIVSDKNLRGLCKAINRPDILKDERFMRGKRLLNMKEFITEVELWSSQRALIECEKILDSQGVPYSRYRPPEDLFTDPQLTHRDAFQKMNDEEGSYWIQNPPFQFDSFSNSTSSSFPKSGEHTNEILEHSLHFTRKQIAQFHEDQVVGSTQK